MTHLLTVTYADIEPNVGGIDTSKFSERKAARAVLFDGAGRVHLLHVSKSGYHKLPGGGIDDGEETAAALARELLEEVGCRAEIVAELGETVEYRAFNACKQTSYSFLARQIGKQVPANLEDDELSEGMHGVLARNIGEAIETLENDNPTNIEGKYIRLRDLAILKEAQKRMRQQP